MFKSLMTASLAIATIAGASMATTTSAEAKNHRGAFVAGAVGGLLVGGLLANQAYGYHRDYYETAPVTYYEPTCFWKKVRVETYYGWKWKKVQICD
jgi:hypothetical protein